MRKNHFVALGRISEDIARTVLQAYTHADHAVDDLQICEPTNVIQSRIGSYKDGECIAELFVDGQVSGYPVTQNLSEAQKRDIVKELNGAHVTIIHSISGENAGNRAMSLLDYVRDLKQEYQVGSITLIAPYAPMRVDRRFKKKGIDEDGQETRLYQRNAVVAENLARRLRQEGVDRFISFDMHSRDSARHYRKHFGYDNNTFSVTSFKNVFCAGLLATAFRAAHNPLTRRGEFGIAVGSPDGLDKPDDLGVMRAKDFALALYEGTKWAAFKKDTPLEDIECMFGIAKDRIGDGISEVKDFNGDVKNRTCALIDDINSSGNTMIKAARRLKKEGAAKVISVAAHGVLVNDNHVKEELIKRTPELLDRIINDEFASLSPDDMKNLLRQRFQDLIEESYVNTTLKKLITSDDIDEIWLTDSIPGVIDKIKAAGLDDHPKIKIVSMAPLIEEQIEWDRSTISYLDWAFPEHVQCRDCDDDTLECDTLSPTQ